MHSRLSLSSAGVLRSRCAAETSHPPARPLCSAVGAPGPRGAAGASPAGHWAGLHRTRWLGAGASGQSRRGERVVIPETEAVKCRYAPGSKEESEIMELSSMCIRGIAF